MFGIERHATLTLKATTDLNSAATNPEVKSIKAKWGENQSPRRKLNQHVTPKPIRSFNEGWSAETGEKYQSWGP